MAVEPVVDPAAVAETARQALRRRKREAKAKCEMGLEQAAAFAEQVRELEDQKAAAKLERNQICNRADSRLREITSTLMQAAGCRQPLDTALKAEQLELYAVKARADEALKKRETELDAAIGPLSNDEVRVRGAAVDGGNPESLRDDLARLPYTRADWAAEHYGWGVVGRALAHPDSVQNETVNGFRDQLDIARTDKGYDVGKCERDFNQQCVISSVIGRVRRHVQESADALWAKMIDE